MNYFKAHPFAVQAFFKRSRVLTFAVPKEDLINMIPSKFELDLYQNQYAFLAVAMVEAIDLRPKGFPKFLGNDFFLIGYRIFVRYINKEGRKMRGLYILKSETNKKKMIWLGNVFTRYNYSCTDIRINDCKSLSRLISKNSALEVKIQTSSTSIKLPNDSPFENWNSARRYAGPMPYTFSYDETNNSVLIVKGVRSNWKPNPIEVVSYNIGFLKQLKLNKLILANAFEIKDVPYEWEKGYIEKWD